MRRIIDALKFLRTVASMPIIVLMGVSGCGK
jgi:ABC-type uncharacterized transport system YnjBCD ATPase subunit